MFFVQTSTLLTFKYPLETHQTWKCCMQINELLTKSRVELEDDTNLQRLPSATENATMYLPDPWICTIAIPDLCIYPRFTNWSWYGVDELLGKHQWFPNQDLERVTLACQILSQFCHWYQGWDLNANSFPWCPRRDLQPSESWGCRQNEALTNYNCPTLMKKQCKIYHCVRFVNCLVTWNKLLVT